MQIVSLVSGGKDSIFSIMHCLALGHHIVALANLFPPNNSSKEDPAGNEQEEEEELDSWMFQSIGHDIVAVIAEECIGLPLYRRPLVRKSIQV